MQRVRRRGGAAEAAAAAQIDFPSVIDTKERKVKDESVSKES